MQLRYLTAGESHGQALIGILEGMPAGLELDFEEIRHQMKRRKLGFGRGFRQKIENDEVQILSGVRHGKTLGSPIGMLIWNQDWSAWQEVMQVTSQPTYLERPRKDVFIPRPGHADLVGAIKYGHSDLRNVLERASARETAIRVALACPARQFLSRLGISVVSRIVQIGEVQDQTNWQSLLRQADVSSYPFCNTEVDKSPVRCLSQEASLKMQEEIQKAKKEGDTLGGVFELIANNVPLGLGSFVSWDRRLEGRLAESLMSLNAIVGVEIGDGFHLASQQGSQVHDAFIPSQKAGRIAYQSRRSGGITGGMSNGQQLVMRVAMKPLATLMKPLPSVNLKNFQAELAHIDRSDVCAAPAAAVIAESLVVLVLADAIIEKFGGDNCQEVEKNVDAWRMSSILE